MPTFADRVRRLRKSANLSQAEFARRLLVSRDYVSQIEGGRMPSPRLMQQIELLEKVGLGGAENADKVGKRENPARTVSQLEESMAARYGDITEGECREYFDRYISRAVRIPGALGHAWVQLKLHLKLSDLDELEKGQK